MSRSHRAAAVSVAAVALAAVALTGCATGGGSPWGTPADSSSAGQRSPKTATQAYYYPLAPGTGALTTTTGWVTQPGTCHGDPPDRTCTPVASHGDTFVAEPGTPVYALHDATIQTANADGVHLRLNGKTVAIYAPLDPADGLRPGQHVHAGQTLGTVQAVPRWRAAAIPYTHGAVVDIAILAAGHWTPPLAWLRTHHARQPHG